MISALILHKKKMILLSAKKVTIKWQPKNAALETKWRKYKKIVTLFHGLSSHVEKETDPASMQLRRNEYTDDKKKKWGKDSFLCCTFANLLKCETSPPI